MQSAKCENKIKSQAQKYHANITEAQKIWDWSWTMKLKTQSLKKKKKKLKEKQYTHKHTRVEGSNHKNAELQNVFTDAFGVRKQQQTEQQSEIEQRRREREMASERRECAAARAVWTEMKWKQLRRGAGGKIRSGTRQFGTFWKCPTRYLGK